MSSKINNTTWRFEIPPPFIPCPFNTEARPLSRPLTKPVSGFSPQSRRLESWHGMAFSFRPYSCL